MSPTTKNFPTSGQREKIEPAAAIPMNLNPTLVDPVVFIPGRSFVSEKVKIANLRINFSFQEKSLNLSVSGNMGPKDIADLGRKVEIASFAHSTTSDIDFSILAATMIVLGVHQIKAIATNPSATKFSKTTKFIFSTDVLATLDLAANLAARAVILINKARICDEWNFTAYNFGFLNTDDLIQMVLKKEFAIFRDENDFTAGIVAKMKCDGGV